MDLRDWIAAEHASVLDRFEHSVVDVVPRELWTDSAGSGGSSIAWLAFHTSFHEDLAVNAVLRGAPTVLSSVRDQLGLAGVPAAVGLGETEVPDATAAIDLDGLHEYVRTVHESTQRWLADARLDGVNDDAHATDALERAGIAEQDVPWLYKMWSGKPIGFFVQWEAVGHRVNHVGEMISVRNRLGLSPF